MLVGVRWPAEFAEGHLPGAVNIDIEDATLPDKIAQLDPAADYAVYWRSGNRSRAALAFGLHQRGRRARGAGRGVAIQSRVVT